ncbi:estradiol 17-beta-dehydrogenase 11 isoform X2 [Halyomorpha halys]|uniref:estradiol 17-beta-dehydrogenase 11 isoform X2 n=1 Tax=Halyomorpha halys TaxID=286706 RepID=UPI0006D4F174|nr:estradiol 17-beta-dehydrogenase 11-like isoform X1 [Halyomorpha halys]
MVRRVGGGGERNTIMFAVARGTAAIPGNNIKNVVTWKNRVLEGFILALEIFYLLFRMTLAILESIYELVLPPKEKCLEGQIALVTGSGHGIGQEIVRRLAAEGCTVVGWDINEEGNAETYKLVKEEGFGSRVHFYSCDVTNRNDVLSTAKRVEEDVGTVSLLINNAGVMVCKPLCQQSAKNIENVFNVNIISHFWTLEAFLPKMKEKNFGHIVAVCSACGVVGLPYAVPYSASKFAVRGLMETLQEELRISENNSSIKFTTVNPIMVDTGLAKKPRNRFPSLVNILTVKEVADCIIKAIKREQSELSVPGFVMTLDRFMRFFPKKVYQYSRDFMDTGVDPE